MKEYKLTEAQCSVIRAGLRLWQSRYALGIKQTDGLWFAINQMATNDGAVSLLSGPEVEDLIKKFLP